MRRLLVRREREGLTLAELSRRTGIPAGTLGWWSSRLRREASRAPAGFVELKPRAETPVRGDRDGKLEVVLDGGRRLLVPPGFDSGELQRLVRVLESGC